jgi:hypothetical protein
MGSQVALSVAAPAAGSGPAASFDLGSQEAASCLAGLSVLGPPGALVPAHLLDANSDPRLSGRVYALAGGHAIWHPAAFLRQPANEPLACLVDNHTDLVAHIVALGGIASWAAERIALHAPVPVAVQPLAKRAALRLSQLHEGLPNKTYRSGIAKVRIDPLVATLATVQATF